MPISIDFLSNVKGFLRGTDDVEAALDDVADALDDATREADKAGDKIGDAFEDAARDTERAGDRMERTFKEVADAAADESKKGADRSSQNYNRLSAEQREAMGEIKNEALQNASETFSSFDGSAQSFADGIQGTLGGLVSGLGPVGAAIGAAGAIGVGLILAGITNADERNQALRERIAELTDELIEAGGVGRRTFGQMADSVKDLATETDESKVNLEDLEKIAESLGRTLPDVTDAYLQGGSALDDLIDKSSELRLAEQERIALITGSDGIADMTRLNQLTDQTRALTEQKEAIEQAQDAELRYLRSGVSEYEVKRATIATVNDAYDDAAGAASGFVDSEAGVFDVTGYIESMTARAAALKDYQTTVASSGLSPEAIAFLNEQGAESAAAMLAGYKAASPEQQAQLQAIWTEAGRENSGEYLAAAQAGLNAGTLTAPGIAVTAPAMDAAINAMQGQLNRRTLGIVLKATDSRGIPL